jgi:hypothetical protein
VAVAVRLISGEHELVVLLTADTAMLVLVVNAQLTASVLTSGVDTVMWLSVVASITLTAASWGCWVSSLSIAVAS